MRVRAPLVLALLVLAAPLASAVGVGVGSGITCSPQSDGVHISWSAQAGASGYHIYRATNGGSAILLHTQTTTSYVDSTAAAGNTYNYTVKAFNTHGTDTATIGSCMVAAVPFFPSALALGAAIVGSGAIVALGVRRARS